MKLTVRVFLVAKGQPKGCLACKSPSQPIRSGELRHRAEEIGWERKASERGECSWIFLEYLWSPWKSSSTSSCCFYSLMPLSWAWVGGPLGWKLDCREVWGPLTFSLAAILDSVDFCWCIVRGTFDLRHLFSEVEVTIVRLKFSGHAGNGFIKRVSLLCQWVWPFPLLPACARWCICRVLAQ